MKRVIAVLIMLSLAFSLTAEWTEEILQRDLKDARVRRIEGVVFIGYGILATIGGAVVISETSRGSSPWTVGIIMTSTGIGWSIGGIIDLLKGIRDGVVAQARIDRVRETGLKEAEEEEQRRKGAKK